MTHLKIRAWLITVVFGVIIALPFLNGKLHFVPDLPSEENRALVQEPRLDSVSLDTFPKLYEEYYADHFSFRFRLADAYCKWKVRLFNTSPFPHRGIIGKDGWLFMADHENNAYLGKYGFDDVELGKFVRELEYRDDYIAQRGGKFYFMIAPSKNNIYSEKLPDSEVRLGTTSWGEHLLDHLAAHSRVRTINAYPALRKDHEVAMTYQKLDNHWTGRGALAATNAALERIHLDFPAVVPQSIADYNITGELSPKGNIAQMIGAKGEFEDSIFEFVLKNGPKAHDVPKVPYPVVEGFPWPEWYEMPAETGDTTKPKVLLITDSFGIAIFPFFRESFQRTVKIWDKWEYKLNEDIVDNEKPDIVVLMVLESNLRNMLAHLSSKDPEK